LRRRTDQLGVGWRDFCDGRLSELMEWLSGERFHIAVDVAGDTFGHDLLRWQRSCLADRVGLSHSRQQFLALVHGGPSLISVIVKLAAGRLLMMAKLGHQASTASWTSR
jgi:hypothetical protein